VGVTLAARWAACGALGLALAACGRQDAPPRDSARATEVVATPSASAMPACPRTGHWTPCQVESRLDRAGVAPRPDSSTAGLPPVGPAPTVYLVGVSRLAIYLFPDSATRARAARALDTAQFISPAASLSMRGEATAIQSDNLLALLFSRRDLQRERVSDALMAGPPQP
jgi:hypothetical protein